MRKGPDRSGPQRGAVTGQFRSKSIIRARQNRASATENRSKARLLLIMLLVAILAQGCATRSSTIPSEPTAGPIDLRVGIEKLVDVRPIGDPERTKSMADLDEKLTIKLLEDFRSSQTFAAVDFPVQRENDDMIIRGQIKRFSWRSELSGLMHMPFLGLIVYYLGGPASDVYGTAHLRLQLVEAKTDGVVAEYDRSATRRRSYSIYNSKVREAGPKLADEVFGEVLKQIRQAILSDVSAGRISLPEKQKR